MLKRMMMSLLAVSLVAGVCHAQTTQPAPTTQPSQASEKVIAEVLGKKINSIDQESLFDLILHELFDAYAKAHSIEPTHEELEAFISRQEKWVNEMPARYEAQKKAIMAELDSGKLNEKQQHQKQEHLKIVESLLANFAQDKQMNAEFQRKSTAEEIQQHQEQMKQHKLQAAIDWIQPCKVQQSLYQTYGGRVTMDAFGPIATDACQAFLKNEKAKGSFAIFDPKLEKEFWAKSATKLHGRAVADKQTADKYMSQPWWLFDKPIEP